MKRKMRVFGVACVLILLCATFLCGSLLGVQATATEANALNFGITGMESNQSVLPSLLFESMLGEQPTAVEKDYLDGVSGISFVYNSAIPDSVVQTEYDGETGTLSVSLPPYTFTATNGVMVEWIPQAAYVGADRQSFTLEDGEYTCRFEGLFHSGDFEIEVDFAWNATIPADAADAILTKPYTAAEAALTDIKAYEAELAAYNAAKEKFLAYEAYVQSVAAYDQYSKVDLPAYEDAMAKYEPYRIATERYEADLAAYEEWQHYWDYVEFMTDDMQKAYAKSQKHQLHLKRIEILDSLFQKDSRGWQLYASLMGGTVDSVIARQNELVAVLPELKKPISQADRSTKALRAMLQEYAAIYNSSEYETEHAKNRAKYDWYLTNYGELKKQFSELYEALWRLGSEQPVLEYAGKRGKADRFVQFISQLYIVQACLDDGEKIGDRWTSYYYKDYIISKIVEKVHLLEDDIKADPASDTVPNEPMSETEVPKIEKVEPIDPPTVPEIKYQPVFDDYLKAVLTEKTEWSSWKVSDWKTGGFPTSEPKKPPVVAKPSDTAPEEAEDPGNAPEAPVMDARLRAIAEALRDGRLPKREAQGRAHTYTLSAAITCPVSISNLKTVTFYSADGKTQLYSYAVEYGSKVVYNGPDTERASDSQYHYQFVAWVLADGTASDMVANTNLSLYAYYQKTPRFYRVTWILDGVSETRNVKYGDLPVCPFITQKTPNAQYVYTFSGWDKEVAPVTEDVTYTGSWVRTPRTYTVTWLVDGRTETETLPYGSILQYTGNTAKAPDTHRYTFTGWDKPITTLTGDVTYTARYSATPLALDASGMPLEITHSDEAITVAVTGKRADIREAARLAREQGKALVICWEQFSLTLQQDALDTLTDSYCTSVGITNTATDESGTTYTVGYLNSAGKRLDMSVPATLQTLANENGGQLAGYLETDGTWTRMDDSGTAVTGSVTFRVGNVYGLKVVSKEPCNLSRLPRFFEEGATVDLSLIGCVFGYEITSATLVTADGRRVALDSLTFAMPKGDAQIELTVEKIVYRVSFVVDGKVIHTAEYGLGEAIIVPEIAPEKAADEFFSYAFTGWSPEVGIAFGEDRDLIFVASFSSTSLGNRGFDLDYRFLQKAITIAVCVFVVLAGGITVTVILLKRRKKKARRPLKEAGRTLAKKPTVRENEPTTEPTEVLEATEETRETETVDQK